MAQPPENLRHLFPASGSGKQHRHGGQAQQYAPSEYLGPVQRMKQGRVVVQDGKQDGGQDGKDDTARHGEQTTSLLIRNSRSRLSMASSGSRSLSGAKA